MAGRVITLSAAAGLMLAGMFEAGDTGVGAALFGVGFVVLGAWLAQEIRNDKEQ